MQEVENELLRKIYHYQQNVPKRYYLLDTLINNTIIPHALVGYEMIIANLEPYAPLLQSHLST